MRFACQGQRAYQLADHVRACRIGEQVILLDLLRNKYLGITGGNRHADLCAAINDWPAASLETPVQEDEIARAIAPLLRQRMLVPATGAPKSWSVALDPHGSLLPELEREPTAINWWSLLSLLSSCAVTSYWLRRRSLADIVERVSASKGGQAPTVETGSALRSAVAQYLHLRPLVMTAHDKCLHDSLTLIRFLAARGLFPQWVIGVQANPFAAHSWVQSGHVVLNDLHENVRRFQPILVV